MVKRVEIKIYDLRDQSVLERFVCICKYVLANRIRT